MDGRQDDYLDPALDDPELDTQASYRSDIEARFDALLAPGLWRDFKTHLTKVGAELERDIAELAKQDKVLREDLRAHLHAEHDIRTVSQSDLDWADKELFDGKVCATDGTYSIYPLLGGIRVQIGVVATAYSNHRTEYVFYVSEQQVNSPDLDPISLLRGRQSENTVLSTLVTRALMAYKERQVALERPEKWKLLNGPIAPGEMRTGLGRFRALEPCLDMLGQVIDHKTAIGVIGTASHRDITALGFGLHPMEYVMLWTWRGDLERYVQRAHFNPADEARFRSFVGKYGDHVAVGLFKAGTRAYVFQAHVDSFHEAAKLVIADSRRQPIRSYPMLIDYADSICTRMLASRDFQRQVEGKVAKSDIALVEMDEHTFRRR